MNPEAVVRPEDAVRAVLDLIEGERNQMRYGPWVVYCSPNLLYLTYLARNMTVRERLLEIEGVSDVRARVGNEICIISDWRAPK